MKKMAYKSVIFTLACTLMLVTSCQEEHEMNIKAFETSSSGKKFEAIDMGIEGDADVNIVINREDEHQEITGFGGSFTEASAYLLNQLSDENRQKIINAYFSDDGARYSLTRTHINSCDFSLGQYSYAPVEGDTALEHFSIEEDMDDIIPMIKSASEVSSEGFKIISSPWTAPPWMKDNNSWVGGKLLKEHYPTWALFFKKYVDAYADQGIKIWGVTVENEPLGNDNNWESMHYTPEEMNDFVKNHLGPLFREHELNVKIMGYDQNRDEELYHWVDIMYGDEEAAEYYDGTAIHWYASTFDYFPEALKYAHEAAPDKHLIQTEACIDAQVPVWQDDDWYWSKEATDWGYNWAPEERKHFHPKYVPAFRYARDIIGCLNNHVDGWVDWNMVLDRQGGPNWFENWCIAPVIVDPDQDEVYFTPLYYVMKHFSKYIRPGAKRIGFDIDSDSIMCTAALNPDGTIAVVLFNENKEKVNVIIKVGDAENQVILNGEAIQTIVFN